jgi:hypothetical protein
VRTQKALESMLEAGDAIEMGIRTTALTVLLALCFASGCIVRAEYQPVPVYYYNTQPAYYRSQPVYYRSQGYYRSQPGYYRETSYRGAPQPVVRDHRYQSQPTYRRAPAARTQYSDHR